MNDTALKIPNWLRKQIILLLVMPTILLVFGIYHGLMQMLYRAGWIHATSFLGIEYYQGLTLHGVINAVVFTTFFEVAFGHALIVYYLGKPLNRVMVTISTAVMVIGVLMAAVPMFLGTASVLYTFYPPLKASPLFYLGVTLLIVGSWFGFWSWISPYLQWRRENPERKTPLAVVGILVTFGVWMMATLPVAYEVLFLIMPWALGLTNYIDPLLARTLFWFFGHPLVYFWILGSYVMFYAMMPKVVGGKLYSDYAARLAFMMFLVLSAPVGLHHQFSDPGINSQFKWLHGVLTFFVTIPSLMTAFTLAASLELAGRARGGTGLFGWWKKLPYFDTERWLFPYFFNGLLLFLFGGITGIINASASMNQIVHNTTWVPAHFHTTVAGPVFMSFIAMTLYLVSQLLGKEIKFKRLNLWVPYLWMIGVYISSIAGSITGLMGQPRRTNLGLTYANPSSPMYVESWKVYSSIMAIGGVIMTVAMVFYFIVFFSTLKSKSVREPSLSFPTAEAFHDEDPGITRNFKPWIIAAILALIFAYGPPLYQIATGRSQEVLGYHTDSPVPDK